MQRKPTFADLDPQQQLCNHITSLGLATVHDYHEWCDTNGFARRLQKRPNERSREVAHAVRDQIKPWLDQKKREQRKPLEVLVAICSGELTDKDVSLPHLKRFAELFISLVKSKPIQQVDGSELFDLIAHLHWCRVEFFDGRALEPSLGNACGNAALEALILIASHRVHWIRDLHDWKPRSRSVRRQFASLVRHLFVHYDEMPAFFDSVWLSGLGSEAQTHREWYLHVSTGKNLCQCDLPIAYTKKMAHHFMRAPKECSVNQTLRWG